MTFLKSHWQLLVLTALILVLWSTDVIAPLKILVVFFHEASHALAAILTGGEVSSIHVHSNESGAAWIRGGNRFLTLSAGYLGSLLFGVAFLWAALKSSFDRWVLAAVGVLMLWITLSYVVGGFALVFGVGVALAFGAIAWFLHNDVSDFVLRVIGLSSMLYVPLDIFSDTIAHAHLRSDAFMLGEEFFGSARIWGAIWLCIAVGVIALCLRGIAGQSTNIDLSRFRRT